MLETHWWMTHSSSCKDLKVYWEISVWKQILCTAVRSVIRGISAKWKRDCTTMIGLNQSPKEACSHFPLHHLYSGFSPLLQVPFLKSHLPSRLHSRAHSSMKPPPHQKASYPLLYPLSFLLMSTWPNLHLVILFPCLLIDPLCSFGVIGKCQKFRHISSKRKVSL